MKPKSLLHLFLFAVSFLVYQQGMACTRATYLGPENTIITGRTMDWFEDIKTNLYFFPRGMSRMGTNDSNGFKWVSKYASLIATAYDVGTVDGMNEKGLVANVLYLADSNYGPNKNKRPTISIAAWAQYVLDSFATVTEAVNTLKKENLHIVTKNLPNGVPALGHLALSDPSGDSAIFEYIDGKLVIHQGKEYQVMTNSPTFDQQLALNVYWQDIGGSVMLPGTSRASDRFVRASYYITAIPQTSNKIEAIASVLSVMCNVSVPIGISTPGKPNIATTIWRTAADQKNLVYYFASTQSPYLFWVPLAAFDLKKDSGVRKLTLTGGEIYGGNAFDKFQPAEPFPFLQ